MANILCDKYTGLNSHMLGVIAPSHWHF